MDELGIYISVPFCRAKCTFCNFASGVYPEAAMRPYVGAVAAQARAARSWAAARSLRLPDRVDTIYLGGGTPSLLPPELLRELFAALRDEFTIEPDAEVTLEAAPLQLAPATLEAALACGVNRVSFGVQSFVTGEARATARMHTGDEAVAEIVRVRTAGVCHVSADLIAGLPGQTGASWRQSLDALCRADLADALDHASVYMFELDEDSRLGAEALRGGVRYGAALLPNEDAVADWYTEACERLAVAALAQYEISNFAREGGRSRHNERYWLRRPYLGLGVDAHSMLREEESGAARFAVGDGLEAFLNEGSWEEPDRLTPRAELEECWFLGLRRIEGVDLRALRAEWGDAAVAGYVPAVQQLCEAGLLAWAPPERVALTVRGRLVSNEVFGAVLEAGDALKRSAESATLPTTTDACATMQAERSG